MSEWALKRFWTETNVAETEGGYSVLLDGRGIRTPAKASLVLPTRPLAQAIAEEWARQEGAVDPNTMPFTRLANAAIDKVRIQRNEVAELLADYADSDLLCYRAERPDELVARQAAAWDPYLDWAADVLGARLLPVQGVMYKAQDPDALARLKSHTFTLSDFELAAFHDLVGLTGSLVLAFASVHRVKSPDEIWDTSRVDELWQIEQWGSDEEAEEVAAVKREAFLHATAAWDCLNPPKSD